MTDRPGPSKSADAYRTISEVADELKLPQHVLRFWETRFPQVKPLKRAGGRRFYRPEDVGLLRAVQALLYDEGYTIRGVQRLLAEFGARHVADALARSRAAPPAEALAGAPTGRGRGEGSGDGMIEDETAGHGEPPRQAIRPPPIRPEAVEPAAAPPRAGARDGLASRLADILADLSECARLLASIRTTTD